MFNLFNKSKKEENPLSAIFNDLTQNQKMSVLNLLLTLASCDGEEGDQNKEIQHLNRYITILGVNGSNCDQYLETGGLSTIINDLKVLSHKQKEFLVVASWEIITCDGRPNEIEIQASGKLFSAIGIDEDEFIAIIQKSQTILKQFES